MQIFPLALPFKVALQGARQLSAYTGTRIDRKGDVWCFKVVIIATIELEKVDRGGYVCAISDWDLLINRRVFSSG